MDEAERWGEPRPFEALTAADFEREGVVFEHGDHLFRTLGTRLGQGGMGNVFALERMGIHSAVLVTEPVVGKTFRPEYLAQLRSDEVTRRDHATTMAALSRIAAISSPGLLPIYLVTPIRDNYLFVSPRKAGTLLEAIARGTLTPRRRVELLVQALGGLTALHDAGLVHRDFTLRNILTDDRHGRAFLFDFDLALPLDEVARTSYKERYQGRIFGSPGCSVPPESISPNLTDSMITQRLDVYAVGGALFSLFTDRLPYGESVDMWGLLFRIAEGVVFHGESRVAYPDTVPESLRPVIDRCLEWDPGHRYGSVREVVRDLEPRIAGLTVQRARRPYVSTPRRPTVDRAARLLTLVTGRADEDVSEAEIDAADRAVAAYGYQLEKSLGRVKGYPIFIAAPSPELVALGQFPDANTYPKLVTAIDLQKVEGRDALVADWLGRFLPVLHSVRQGMMPALYRVVHDQPSQHLLLFTEVVNDPRFGTDLERHDLTLAEVMGIGFLIARQVGRLHEHGIAHNNVLPASLLLKGLRETRQVQPAMVGLVGPSLEPGARAEDVRNLAKLVMSWIRPARVEAVEPRLRPRIDNVRNCLATAAFSEGEVPPIDWLVQVLSEGLCVIDANFDILRRNAGDLEAHALLLESLPLYSRLWHD